MSSILKALKKLEHEKSQSIANSLNIDADILRGSDAPRNSSPLVMALLLLLFFGGGAAVAIYFVKDTKSQPAATNPKPVITEKTLQMQLDPPVIKTETLPAEIVVVPASRAQNNDVMQKQLRKPLVAGKAAVSIVSNSAAMAVSVKPEQPKAAEEAAKHGIPAAPSTPAATTTSVLRVNGIAFQGKSSESMAIVNGTPVANGSTIDGATVEEIRNDRVLFSRNGEKFEVQMGQSK